MEIVVESLEGLEKAVKVLFDFAGNRKKMIFSGEIGAGKTTLIKSMCRFLKVAEQVSSPTFSIVNEYTFKDSQDGSEQLVHHIDLYRLKSFQEAIDIGIEDYLYDDYFCLIEWPEIIAPLLPQELVKINIEILNDSSRKIIFL